MKLTSGMLKIKTGLAAGLAVAALASAASLLGPDPAASADTGGQQVVFNLGCGGLWHESGCPTGLDAVKITGTNQDGQSATWYGSGNGGAQVKTTSWWWVGNITVSYNLNHVSQPPIHAWVPASESAGYAKAAGNNWVDVQVAIGGTMYYGDSVYDGGPVVSAGPDVPVSTGFSATCISGDDPLGQATFVKVWTGYYGRGWNASTVTYSIVGPGIAPYFIDAVYGPYPVCD